MSRYPDLPIFACVENQEAVVVVSADSAIDQARIKRLADAICFIAALISIKFYRVEFEEPGVLRVAIRLGPSLFFVIVSLLFN